VAKQAPRPDAKEPWWVEYGASFFPVILVVFLLRSFVVEPFKIPSGSMIPTLLVGDFILVNKYTYGIRLPVINKKVVDVNRPSAATSWSSASRRILRSITSSVWSACPATRWPTSTSGCSSTAWRCPVARQAIISIRPPVLFPSIRKARRRRAQVIVDKDAPAFVSQVMQYPAATTAPTIAAA
jgi:signal peptidase I